MLIEKSASRTRITQLEIKYFDSLWITILLDNTKLLVSTASIGPQSKDHMQMWIEQRKKAFDYAKQEQT